MNLVDARLLFLDLQTTGAKPESANILEVAWCIGAAASSDPEKTCARLVRQPEGESVPARIRAITGISDEDMIDAFDWQDVRAELTRELQEIFPFTVIHYAQFERPFLSTHLPELMEGAPLLCTHQIAARLFPNLPSRGIRGLAGFFGNPIHECKRATSHVQATFAIWQSLCRELKMRGIETFAQLQQWLSASQAAKRTKYEYPLDSKLRLELPDLPGVYRMLSRAGDVLYVGKATSLNSRVNSYFRGKRKKDPRKLEMLTQTWNLDTTVCQSVLEACLLEVDEIKRLQPPYNVALKVADRALVFYDRDFASMSPAPTAQHGVGPFRSDQVMAPLLMLTHSIASNDFNLPIFFDEVEPQLLHEGFLLWLDRHGLELSAVAGTRALLAHGLRQYREYRRWLRQQAALLEQASDQSNEEETTLLDDEDDIAEEGEPEELTAEDVANRYDRLLFHCARAYLLGRRLTRLLNADIQFQEGKKLRTLTVRDGAVVRDEVAQCTLAGVAAWSSLGLNVYDRMRVLDTELNRLRAAGGCVSVTLSVEPGAPTRVPDTETPLKLSHRSASAFS